MKAHILVITTILAVTLIGCNGDSPTLPVAARAAVTISIDPDPIIATESGRSDYPWRIEWNVTYVETAGLGCSVNYVDVTQRDLTTGIEVGTWRWGASDVVNDAGTNHIYAFGSLTHHQALFYRLAFGGRQSTLTVSAELRDDNGNIITVSTEVDVV